MIQIDVTVTKDMSLEDLVKFLTKAKMAMPSALVVISPDFDSDEQKITIYEQQ